MSKPPRTAEQKPPAEPSFLGWRRGDRWFLGVTLLVLTVLLGVHVARIKGWTIRSSVRVLTRDDYLYTLDVNHATWVEWAQLDGIGETPARRIIDDRQDRGEFTTIEDVARVKGIGPKTLARIRPHLRHSEQQTVAR